MTDAVESCDWSWNQSPHGYDGVRTEAGGLLWYTHSHQSLAGGGASLQTYAEFLSGGPAQAIPAEVLAEVRAYVAALPGPATG